MERQIILKNEIANLGLPNINTVKYLNNAEPVIYLCGKSSTGKTMFLNALFNMDKDELFTSTDISTKTEFRFQFADEESIINSDGKVINLPTEFSKRKELFKSLNKEGDKYIVYLNQKALYGRSIVDIPGVFDFNRNDNFSNQMIDEADIIYFFSPCIAKINALEYELLNSISNAGIPIIVLFTMGDITDPDEGITRNTIPNFVQGRLDTCFRGINISHHQIISANDFYNGKDSHGIDKLQLHINHNDLNYKKIAEGNRLKRTASYYLDLIEKRLAELNEDSESFIRLVHRKNQLWYKTENRNIGDEQLNTISNISSELNRLSQDCEDRIYGKFYNKLFSKQNLSNSEQKEKLQSNWNGFWIKFTNEFTFLQVRTPILPELEEDLFEQISINTTKLNELLGVNQEADTKSIEKKSNSDQEDKKSKNMSLSDFIKISQEIGVNISNASILFKKWSFLNRISDIIESNKCQFIEQAKIVFDNKVSNLEIEMNNRIKNEILEDPAREIINSYNASLINLKQILNDIPNS